MTAAGFSSAENSALTRALQLARDSGVRRGPNPAVGCILLDAHGTVIAEGFHRGPGTPHAEVEALRAAGTASRGATAVVSLEPCAHHGRTPPCAEALIDAGVQRVVFAQFDPNPQAAGGAQVLGAAGVEVVGGVRAEEARDVNPVWSAAVALGRPWVTWKVAASLDGLIAASDGTSKWITSEQSREDVHRLRDRVDAVLTGTGTALADRPELTARPGGLLAAEQPLRAVMGQRDLPDDHPLSGAVRLATRDPRAALEQLWELDARHVLLECGAQLAAAFLAADLVDEIVWFAAPVLLGGQGTPVLEVGPDTLSQARAWHVRAVERCGPDVRIDLTRTVESQQVGPHSSEEE